MSEESKKNPKPQIIPLPNGPFSYFTDFTPKEVDGIVNSCNEKISNLIGTAFAAAVLQTINLSAWGAHGQIGFKDDKNW